MVYRPIDDSRFSGPGGPNIVDGAMTIASLANWSAAGTVGVNMLNLAGFLYAYEADSADMAAAYANNDPVGTWHETNNTLDLTGGVDPIYLTAGLGGEPAVRFPQGTTARAFRASANSWFGSDTQTIYAVCRPDTFTASTGLGSLPQAVVANWNAASTTASHWLLRRAQLSSTTRQWQYLTRTSANVQVSTVGPVDGTASDELDTVVTARWNAGPTRIRINGTNGTDNTQTGTFRTTSSANLTIGDTTTTTYGSPFRGEIACVYIYTAAHSDDTIANVEQYLADKYGITL
jgi:hypothetical protein